MAKSLREKYSLSLQSRNWTIEFSSIKCWILVNPKKGYKFFLGRSGSVRKGRIKSESIPVSDQFKKILLFTFKQSQNKL